MSYVERRDCRLCTGEIAEILRLVDTPIANALVKREQLGREGSWQDWDNPELFYPLYLAQCQSCGHVQLPVEINSRLLFPADYPYVSGTSPIFVRHLEEQAAAIHAHCGLTAGANVVEIGSNDGTLLGIMRRKYGYRVLGIDPALNLARSATESGMLTLGAAFSEYLGQAIAEDFGSAKVVVANNVLAHSSDLLGMLKGIHMLLEPGGTLVLEVGYLPDVVAANNFPTIYHEHLAYHSLGPLCRAFSELGMTAYHAHRVDSQGGSIRVYVTNAADAPVSTPLRELLEEERSLPGALASWPRRIDEATSKLYSMLRALKSDGKTIAGYGAAAKATTLLHQCGIGADLLDCVFDANPRKIGKFLPGNHIPIVDKSELETRAPDYCVILSGNFAESIMAQHPGFMGRWVSPLPMPVVLGEEMAA